MEIDKKKYMLSLLKEKIMSERKSKEAEEELIRLFGECRHIPVQIHCGEVMCACCGKRIYIDDEDAYGREKIYVGFINEKANSWRELYEKRMKIAQDSIIETWGDFPELSKSELMYEVETKIRKRYLKTIMRGDNNV